MRAIGTTQRLSWRWTPFVALVLGSLAFAVFTALAVPSRIGADAPPAAAHLRFKSQPASFAKPGDAPAPDAELNEPATDERVSPTRLVAAVGADAARLASSVSKRGFTPPLARPESPAPAPQPTLVIAPPPVPPPAPVAEAAASASASASAAPQSN